MQPVSPPRWRRGCSLRCPTASSAWGRCAVGRCTVGRGQFAPCSFGRCASTRSHFVGVASLRCWDSPAFSEPWPLFSLEANEQIVFKWPHWGSALMCYNIQWMQGRHRTFSRVPARVDLSGNRGGARSHPPPLLFRVDWFGRCGVRCVRVGDAALAVSVSSGSSMICCSAHQPQNASNLTFLP